MKVAIVVGHSSKDGGAVNITTGLNEFTYNSDLATMIASVIKGKYSALESTIVFRGATLASEVENINACEPNFSVSLHANAGGASQLVNDPSEFLKKGGKIQDIISNPSGSETLFRDDSKWCTALATVCQEEIVKALCLKNRGLKPTLRTGRGGMTLYGTKQPIVIVEPFFISNDKDLLIALHKKKALAEAIAKACWRYAAEKK